MRSAMWRRRCGNEAPMAGLLGPLGLLGLLLVLHGGVATARGGVRDALTSMRFAVDVEVRLHGIGGGVDGHDRYSRALQAELEEKMPERRPELRHRVSKGMSHVLYQFDYQVHGLAREADSVLQAYEAALRRLLQKGEEAQGGEDHGEGCGPAAVPLDEIFNDEGLREALGEFDSAKESATDHDTTKEESGRGSNPFVVHLLYPVNVVQQRIIHKQSMHSLVVTDKYGTSGGRCDCSQSLILRGNAVLVDMAAVPCMLERETGIDEGEVITLPRATAEAVKPDERGLTLLSHTVVSAVQHVTAQDIAFSAGQSALSLLFPVLVMRNAYLSPDGSEDEQQGIVDQARVADAVASALLPFQDLVVLKSMHTVHEHPRAAVATINAIRTFTQRTPLHLHAGAGRGADSSGVGIVTEEVPYIDSRRLLSEMRASSDTIVQRLVRETGGQPDALLRVDLALAASGATSNTASSATGAHTTAKQHAEAQSERQAAGRRERVGSATNTRPGAVRSGPAGLEPHGPGGRGSSDGLKDAGLAGFDGWLLSANVLWSDTPLSRLYRSLHSHVFTSSSLEDMEARSSVTVVPILVLSNTHVHVESGWGVEDLPVQPLLDRETLYNANGDAIIVLHSDEPVYVRHQDEVSHGRVLDLSDATPLVVAGIMQRVMGLNAPTLPLSYDVAGEVGGGLRRVAGQSGDVVMDHTWMAGAHPFPPYGNSAELSEALVATARRNMVLGEVEFSACLLEVLEEVSEHTAHMLVDLFAKEGEEPDPETTALEPEDDGAAEAEGEEQDAANAEEEDIEEGLEHLERQQQQQEEGEEAVVEQLTESMDETADSTVLRHLRASEHIRKVLRYPSVREALPPYVVKTLRLVVSDLEYTEEMWEHMTQPTWNEEALFELVTAASILEGEIRSLYRQVMSRLLEVQSELSCFDVYLPHFLSNRRPSSV